jgi:ribosomal protein S1
MTTQDQDEVDWGKIAELYPIGSVIEGKVVHHAPFGMFLNIGHPYILGLVNIVEFLDEGRMTPDQYPPVDTLVKGVVLAYTPHNKQVRVSMKPATLASVHPLSLL